MSSCYRKLYISKSEQFLIQY